MCSAIIHIASRTKAKCDAIIASVHDKNAMKQDGVFEGHALDALDIEATKALIKRPGPDRHQCRHRLPQHVGDARLHRHRRRLYRHRHP
jgi:hypothetical protein